MQLIRADQFETLKALETALNNAAEEAIVIIGNDIQYLTEEEDRTHLIHTIHDAEQLITVASNDSVFTRQARRHHVIPITRYNAVKKKLENHPEQEEALRSFAPKLWQRSLKNKLQTSGLLTVPRARVLTLSIICILVFLFVFFRLLPGATIMVWPKEEAVSHTVNVFLLGDTSTGVTVGEIPEKATTQTMIPITVSTALSYTYTDISKAFAGTSSVVTMSVVNESFGPITLRKDTRFVNQAGMIFLLQESVVVPAEDERNVLTIANDKDDYGEIIGERGNVPAGLKWDIPGLSDSLQQVVYGENRVAASEGTTAFVPVVTAYDLKQAQKALEAQLLREANLLLEDKYIDVQKELGIDLEVMNRTRHDALRVVEYSDVDINEGFIGQQMQSFPISATVTVTRFGFDKASILQQLRNEIITREEQYHNVISESLTIDNMEYHVIRYHDDLRWVKVTATLHAVEQTDLTPYSETGKEFRERLRTAIVGKPYDEALRITRNFQEVNHATISIWPPWHDLLPTVAANIRVEEQDE
jgi:hypothetical protein